MRIERITSRCNFFEIYRNENLFNKETYHQLLNKSLAKTAKTDLPPELKEYAEQVQALENSNPGQFYIAAKFGQAIPGVNSSELMASKDFKIAFSQDSQMPSQLEKALAKYSERL